MHEEHKGELLVLSESALWALFPIIALLSYQSLTPLMSAAITILLGAVFFALLLTGKGSWGELKRKAAYKPIIYSALLIGVAYYTFLFIGLSLTSAGDASIALLMEIFFTYLILCLWGKERFDKKHAIGAILMAIGAVIILSPSAGGSFLGNLIIIVGTIFPPVGNYFQQQARKLVSAPAILFVRSLISGSIIMVAALICEGPLPSGSISAALPFLLYNGIFMMGVSKIMWIEAIHRLPITKATSLNTVTPAYTLLFAFLILGDIPTWTQMAGFIPILIGAQFLITKTVSLG